jgi:hypothetical protein
MHESQRTAGRVEFGEPKQGRRRFLKMVALGALACSGPLAGRGAQAAAPPPGWPMGE